MRLYSILAIAALASASLIARADTYITFNVDNLTFNNSGSENVTGTLTFDSTSHTFTGADLTSSGFSNFIGENGNDSIDGALTNSNYSQGTVGYSTHKLEYVDITMASGNTLDLFLPVSSLVGYDGGQLCASDNGTDCHNYGTSSYSAQYFFFVPYTTSYDAKTGSLDPQNDPAPTPEPSSLLLLGTGLVGVAGALRRRSI